MTISLENAKKLYKVAKEKGVALPKSIWCWANDYDTNYCVALSKSKTALYGEPTYPAYTTDELLEWLLKRIYSPYLLFWTGKDGKLYTSLENGELDSGNGVETPADALCQLAIKLIKEGIIK